MASDKSPGPRSIPFRRFIDLARPEGRNLIIATVALFIAAGMGLVYPQGIKIIMNAVAGQLSRGEPGARATVTRAALGLLAVFALQGAFSALRAYLFNLSGERVVARLRRGEHFTIAGARHEIMMETDDLRALFWEGFDRLARGVLGP